MSNHCTECVFRRERVIRTAKGIDFSSTHQAEITTNKKGFCYIGYTQNPLTLEATQNAIRNGAEVCSVNPYKNKATS